jgi:hypothetical protein
MRRTILCILALAAIAPLLSAFESDKAPKTVTMEGTVSAVSLVAGEQMCYLMMRPAADTAEGRMPDAGERKVMLGSVRYLMDKGFNPKAGDAIKVVGFPLADNAVAAARIELPGKKQNVQFRDNAGRPLWGAGRGSGSGVGGPGMGGPGMGGGRGGGRGPRNRGGGR